MSPNPHFDDKAPPTAIEQTGATNGAAVKVRASEFSGLAGKLTTVERIGAVALAVAAAVFIVGMTWRLAT